MKTLEAKPFDQNAENWKRENRLFTSTALEAGASAQNQIGTHALRSHRTVWFVFHCSNSCFLLETGIAGHERLLLAKWHPKSEKKLRKRPFFDSADRHEKLYGRSRLYASAGGRHETGGVLSLFSSLSFDISTKNSMQRWSSDFQGLFCVKIRKMAQGSNDLSTLPLKNMFLHMSGVFCTNNAQAPSLFSEKREGACALFVQNTPDMFNNLPSARKTLLVFTH